MDLTKIKLDEFLAAGPDDHGGTATDMPRGMIVPPGTGNGRDVLAEADGYRIVDLGEGYVAAVDAAGDEAGFYTSNSLIVHPEHRGKGLAVALALWAHHGRDGLPGSRSLSAGGRKALTAAWEVANGKRESPWWPPAGGGGTP